MKYYKDRISINKSAIASIEDDIISYEKELGGRGESSIIRYQGFSQCAVEWRCASQLQLH